MRRYAGVLLDVDGTLVESNDAHAHAWVKALDDAGYACSFERARRMIGMGGDRLIETVTGLEIGSKANQKLAQHRGEVFREHWLPTIRPLNGTRDFVLRLKSEGYLFAIATAAKQQDLQALLEIGDVADLCEVRTTSSDVEASKPDRAIIDAALAQLPVERSRTVMIGDTPYDIEAARSANVDTIGFGSGGWSVEALAGAVAVYRGPADLLARWAESPLA